MGAKRLRRQGLDGANRGDFGNVSPLRRQVLKRIVEDTKVWMVLGFMKPKYDWSRNWFFDCLGFASYWLGLVWYCTRIQAREEAPRLARFTVSHCSSNEVLWSSLVFFVAMHHTWASNHFDVWFLRTLLQLLFRRSPTRVVPASSGLSADTSCPSGAFLLCTVCAVLFWPARKGQPRGEWVV